MYRLFFTLSDGTRQYGPQFTTEEQALTARWNWALRGEVYGIESPTGELV